MTLWFAFLAQWGQARHKAPPFARRPDAFERHAKVCTPNNPGKPGVPTNGPTAAPRAGGGGGAARGSGGGGNYDARPRAYNCYLVGCVLCCCAAGATWIALWGSCTWVSSRRVCQDACV